MLKDIKHFRKRISKKTIRAYRKHNLIEFVINGAAICVFTAINLLVVGLFQFLQVENLVYPLLEWFLIILGIEYYVFKKAIKLYDPEYSYKILEKLMSAEEYIHSFFSMEYDIIPHKNHAVLFSYGERISNVKIAKRYWGYPVTEIESLAFKDNKVIKDFILPKEITNISSFALSGCSNIESLSVEDGNPVYYSEGNCIIEKETNKIVLGCKNSLIPEGVEFIYPGAFYGLESIVSIHLPSSVSSIGREAFYGCVNLEEINLDFVTDIKEGAFAECKKLEKISISNDITYIGKDAFLNTGYYSNKENWQSGVLYIDGALVDVEEKMQGCYRVNDDTLLIANEAFNDCSNLEGISIPSSVKYINEKAFDGCSNMSKISVDEDNAFYFSDSNCLILRDGNKLIKGCKQGDVSDRAVSIGRRAFDGYNDIEEIVIPDGITSLETGALFFCDKVKRVSIPKSVSYISKGAFRGCHSLESIDIDDNPTYKLEGKSIVTKNDGELVVCLDGIVPDGVTSVCGSSFSSLDTGYIIVPKSVKKIDSVLAFRLLKIKEIYYKGKKEEWDQIYVDPEEREFLNMDIYYYRKYNHCYEEGKNWCYNKEGEIYVFDEDE